MPFTVPLTLETAYRALISKTIMSWLPERHNGISDSYWLQELMNVSTQNKVVSVATSIATGLITRVNVVNVRSWREAALKTQRSGVLYDLLSQELSGRIGVRVSSLLESNARYLADIPHDVAVQLSKEIAAAQQQGTRPEAISSMLRLRFPQVLGNKIKTIARTQCSSAGTALTRARCEELDLSCFVWETSQDGNRVRSSHRNMQGTVVFWKDLPSPEELIGQKSIFGHYAPGDCTNCRCNPLPVLTSEDVFSIKKNSARVYANGSIKLMTKAQFTSLSGIESRLAA